MARLIGGEDITNEAGIAILPSQRPPRRNGCFSCGWPQAHGRIRVKVMTVAAILNMANVRAIKIASRIETSLTDSR
jgi:hypothetical protein